VNGTLTREERDASMSFRYNPKSKNPKTKLHTIHTWNGLAQTRCWCGRFSKDDPRLVEVKRQDLPNVGGLFCKRCIWGDSDAERRLNPYIERT